MTSGNTLNCCKVHGAVGDDALARLLSLLSAHCVTFGADFDSLEQSYCTLPALAPSSVLLVTRDQLHKTWFASVLAPPLFGVFAHAT